MDDRMDDRMDDDELRDWLKTAKRIAVIGLSPVAARPSYGVTRYMIAQGYEIFGIRPASQEMILNRPCVESLAELEEDVDIFDVFRNADAVPQVVEEIGAWLTRFAKRPRLLWLQEGVGHPEAEKRARELGLDVVSNLCILKEHARLL